MNASRTPAHSPAHADTEIPARMSAVIAHRYGGPEVLEQDVIERPTTIVDDEVLVEVHAAGVDRGTWHLMEGKPYLIRMIGFGLTRPKQPVPGLDLAGVVVAVGSAVTRFAVGDEVFGIGSGAFAEYAVAPERKLSHKPNGISFEQAAVTAISGSTALQALTNVGGVEAGQSVLVIGASGGVGSYAVQIATALGAHVTGVASAAKADAVRSLGAEQVIDYATTDYLDGRRQYDLIIDCGGLNPVHRLQRALNPTGTLVIVGGEGGGNLTGGSGRTLRAAVMSLFSRKTFKGFLNKESHDSTDRLAELMDAGSIVPEVGSRYSLDQACEAITDLAAGRITGKAVIVVRQGDR